MCRPDAASGEQMSVGGAKLVHRTDNPRWHIRQHPPLLQLDAEQGQSFGNEIDIHILRAAGQDLVADDQNGGGGVAHKKSRSMGMRGRAGGGMGYPPSRSGATHASAWPSFGIGLPVQRRQRNS